MQRLRERLTARPSQAARPPSLPGAPLQQLLVTERGGTRVVPVAEIQWLETADNYVVLHTSQGAPLLRQTLTDLLDSLGGDFVRCHRRAAVRLSLVEKIDSQGWLVLRGGALVPLGRNNKAAIVEALAHRQSR
jgi:two-component system LytT family response regulator